MNETDYLPLSVEPAQPESAVVKELLDAFRDPNLDVDHIVELIACEPALSSEILRRGNSVRFCSKEPATDLFVAITRIGMNEAYSALVGLRA